MQQCWHAKASFENKMKKRKKYLNFRFVADFEDSCLTDTEAWLAYVSSIQNESEEGYTYIRSCPISSLAEGLIYVFCWHHLTGTLVLQMGTGDVVRTISLQVTHCQNDVRGAGSEDYGLRQNWREKKKLLRASPLAFRAPSGRLPCQHQRSKHLCSKTNDNSIILNALKVSFSCRTQLQW